MTAKTVWKKPSAGSYGWMISWIPGYRDGHARRVTDAEVVHRTDERSEVPDDPVLVAHQASEVIVGV